MSPVQTSYCLLEGASLALVSQNSAFASGFVLCDVITNRCIISYDTVDNSAVKEGLYTLLPVDYCCSREIFIQGLFDRLTR